MSDSLEFDLPRLFCCISAFFQVNFPSSIFSSIDLTYIEDKYSSLPNQALLDVWSSLKGHKGTSYKFNNAKLEYGSVDSSPVPLPLRLLKAIDRILDEIKFHGYEHGQDCYMLYAIMRSSIYYERIWVPTNPRGAERLPPGIIVAESDLYIRRLWGYPSKDVINKPRYLFTFTVGYDQKNNIDAAVRKLTGNFTVMLFHYDGRESEWNEFEWSKRAIHVSARKQAKWWYAKRFLHPDIVVPYDYIFIWDEDLGVQNFDPEEYIKLVNKHDLHISQPGLSPDGGMTWEMTRRREDIEVHKSTEERPGWCTDPRLPPCAAFVEIMAPVFSRDAWRCVWHLIQNDLVHGWGLDFALRMCAEPAHEKIGVVDSQWIVHQTVPSLGNQGEVVDGRAPWEGLCNMTAAAAT
ncbi:UNVERIFIED_CONTAM: hypothetical protein Sradi_0787600 [Sesamum radiatum]|uniref:Uncharacterized protein n=1 Tax=Sesamum radiatum TaxID=300843 RepID=A0AAW2VR82_SESRA